MIAVVFAWMSVNTKIVLGPVPEFELFAPLPRQHLFLSLDRFPLMNKIRIDLNSLRKKLSKRCLTRIYKGYIRPRLEYACAVWSGGNTSKLLKLQQKFCRQHQVQLPNLSNRFKFHTLTLFYKIRNGLAPTYLSEILPETLALSSGRNLRRHVYPFPRINKSSTMQSFLPRATVFWNELPASIQSSSSLHSFKAKLRDLLKI